MGPDNDSAPPLVCAVLSAVSSFLSFGDCYFGCAVFLCGSNIYFWEEGLDDVGVCFQVVGAVGDEEAAPSDQGHGEEELIGEVTTYYGSAGEILVHLFGDFFGDGISRASWFAEGSYALGYVGKLNGGGEGVACAGGGGVFGDGA